MKICILKRFELSLDLAHTMKSEVVKSVVDREIIMNFFEDEWNRLQAEGYQVDYYKGGFSYKVDGALRGDYVVAYDYDVIDLGKDISDVAKHIAMYV